MTLNKALPLVSFFLLLLVVSDSHAQSNNPIEARGLLAALESEILSKVELVERLQKRGVSFQLSPALEKRIRTKGKYLGNKGLDDLVAAVRDNYRPKKPTSSSAPAITQTITNSPGAVQVAGDLVQSDRRLIQSLVLHISLEVETQQKEVTEEQLDWGLGSIIALFTQDNKRIRFASDLRIMDQQVSPKVRRLSFVYTPEKLDEIHGREIKFLGSIKVLAVNYAQILKDQKFEDSNEAAKLVLHVILNGLQLGPLSVNVPAGALTSGQANMDVSSLFQEIPRAYDAAVSR